MDLLLSLFLGREDYDWAKFVTKQIPISPISTIRYPNKKKHSSHFKKGLTIYSLKETYFFLSMEKKEVFMDIQANIHTYTYITLYFQTKEQIFRI